MPTNDPATQPEQALGDDIHSKMARIERDNASLSNRLHAAEIKVADLGTENAKLRETLKFYAEPDSYHWSGMTKVMEDRGSRALDALNNT